MELRVARGVLGASVLPCFGLGEAVDEVAKVAGADQPADGRMVAWRHGPVIAGGAPAPDPPVRVLAAEPLKFGALVVPALAGVHGGRQLTAGPACAPWMSPGMACAGMPRRGGGRQLGVDGRVCHGAAFLAGAIGASLGPGAAGGWAARRMAPARSPASRADR
jgi:hypothetical protein